MQFARPNSQLGKRVTLRPEDAPVGNRRRLLAGTGPSHQQSCTTDPKRGSRKRRPDSCSSPGTGRTVDSPFRNRRFRPASPRSGLCTSGAWFARSPREFRYRRICKFRLAGFIARTSAINAPDDLPRYIYGRDSTRPQAPAGYQILVRPFCHLPKLYFGFCVRSYAILRLVLRRHFQNRAF